MAETDSRKTSRRRATGKPLPHDSARLHVSGTAAYTDDLPEPRDLLHLAVGLSDRAHARIRKLDLTAVLAADGVVDVCTTADIAGENNCGPIIHDEKILNDELVEYAGQAIFTVAADIDPTAVEQNWRDSRRGNRPLMLPLVADAVIGDGHGIGIGHG